MLKEINVKKRTALPYPNVAMIESIKPRKENVFQSLIDASWLILTQGFAKYATGDITR